MNLLLLLLRNPLKTCKFAYTWFAQSLLPLRLQLQRAYLSSCSATFPDLTHRLPVGPVTESRARLVVGDGFKAYLVPGDKVHLLKPGTKKSGRRCTVVYAHGGGYARGEAKMYLNYMERWVRVAEDAGLDLAFVSVEYPLSGEVPHPAQRDAFLGAYRHLLASGVPPSEIMFMGDSAGGGLSILSGIECQRQGLAQPAGSILVSPWMDATMPAHNGGNALVETDYVIGANNSTPALYSLWLRDIPPTDFDVNPLYQQPGDIHGLNPQLILVGAGEFALQDSKDWAELCAKAGVKHRLVCEWGQLHIYAMGSTWLEPSVRRKTELSIVDWIAICVADTH
ncbi:uncharacterized protein HMPREF1541_08927 [Cyphellophora europaea CBS 101466]|uniref:Alpha/beta hydrolase fold-3 domain-containing protein n=1 Tax=Cyphellophora europaea (strain CBS 101466) TaxID=1220924 RepID=W2RLN6_CYPE1|nr:uncharacterized protein HMPREF1541_08927 [Cyphellophora europaea CBS 101466]ETN36649.1 hypothetical protein HMPREF1541_08927 [Cyphellophora europaea CBS 101466]